jgi:hypothetical protein
MRAKSLRTTFRRLHPQLPHGHSPVRHFVTKAADTVSRLPIITGARSPCFQLDAWAALRRMRTIPVDRA